MKKIFTFLFFALPAMGMAQSPTSKKAVPAKSSNAYKKVTIYTTADKSELRISRTEALDFKDFKQPFENQPCIFVDPAQTYQTMVGIGAALTDASAETFYKLPKASREELLTAYFSTDKGIGYNLARTNINSCDFSSDMYTYVADNDRELKTFSIAHDEKFKIPFIKEAMAAAGGKLSIFASPWSPPAWMKDNNSMLQGGKLLPAHMQTWANYYVKFVKEYEARQIPIWGLTVQNEPMAKQRWESCIFTAEEERDFIKNFMGPTLKKAGMRGKKMIAWDHNRDLIYQRASVILRDKEAARYVWGIGFHWYETWTGGTMQFDNLKLVAEAFPDKQLFFTEGCTERFSMERINEWTLGEKYGLSMINDFNAGTAGWTDWNILLDETGGPNHVGNFCLAPIHADTRTGKLLYSNSYYYIGHFSKFIRAGAKRIASSSSRSQLLTTAFLNTDGSIAVVVMNQTDKDMPHHIWMDGRAVETISKAHSIATMMIE